MNFYNNPGNVTTLTFYFKIVEEEPLLGTLKVSILLTIAIFILTFGLLIQVKICFLLNKKESEGTNVAIDKIYRVNNAMNLICQTPYIIYLIVSFFVYPMSDIIGIYGCLILPHFLQIYTIFYCLLFPMSIALTRYIFVLQSQWVNKFGIIKLINVIICTLIIAPAFLTLSIQYPIYDYIHGPFNYCRGRFEVFFNPTHPDAITPGRREGERHCIETYKWAFNDNVQDESVYKYFFKVAVYFCCKISRNLFYIFTLSLPEIFLYSFTFIHIAKHDKWAALKGIVKPEAFKRRRTQNFVNIYVTFWAWLMQFITNMFIVVIVKFMFGKDQFVMLIMGFISFFLTFNLLPLIYIIMGNENLKRAFASKNYFDIIQQLFKI